MHATVTVAVVVSLGAPPVVVVVEVVTVVVSGAAAPSPDVVMVVDVPEPSGPMLNVNWNMPPCPAASGGLGASEACSVAGGGPSVPMAGTGGADA